MNSTDPTAIPGGSLFQQTNDRISVNTFTGVVRYAAIPDKLDTELRYTLSNGVDNQNLLFATGINPACPTGMPVGFNCQFPNVTSLFQRLDATATYTFDNT